MTEAPPIQVALAAVKNAVGAVGKNQRNTAQNFNFRGVDAVVNAAAPALNEHGVIILPRLVSYTYEQITTSGGKQAAHVIVEVEYVFTGPAGDSLISRVPAEAIDFGDKAVPKAMSVAYRTALLQVLNLPTDEPDPDESSFERDGRVTKGQARPNPVRAPVITDAQELLKLAEAATSPEAVLKLYETAGTNGWLRDKKAHPVTGEVVVVMDYLVKRGTDLKQSKSAGAGAAGTRGSGSK